MLTCDYTSNFPSAGVSRLSMPWRLTSPRLPPRLRPSPEFSGSHFGVSALAGGKRIGLGPRFLQSTGHKACLQQHKRLLGWPGHYGHCGYYGAGQVSCTCIGCVQQAQGLGEGGGMGRREDRERPGLWVG